MTERVDIVKDLLILKYKGQSKITVEGYAGYFVVKKNGDIKFNALQYPLALSSMITCELSDPFKVFQRKLSDSTSKITRRSPDFKTINNSLFMYIKKQIFKDPSFGVKLLAANKKKDKEVMKALIVEFFENWVEQLKLDIAVEDMSYLDFSKQVSTFSTTEDILSVLSREDLKNLSEAYPIVDPINGKSITSFAIGEEIYFTVLKFSNDESRSKIVEAFPESFDESGENTQPLVGKLISKELVEDIGNEFMLVKISCKGVYFKAIIYTNMNIKIPTVNVPKTPSPFINNDSGRNESKHHRNFQEYEKSGSDKKSKINFFDLLIAMTFVGAAAIVIMIIINFFS